MTKEELAKAFQTDFKKTQGALSEVISHNRTLDSLLVQDLMEGDYNKLEEHIELSKLIMEGVKGFNELYKNTPAVISAIEKLSSAGNKDEKKVSLADIMGDIDDEDDDSDDSEKEVENKTK